MAHFWKQHSKVPASDQLFILQKLKPITSEVSLHLQSISLQQCVKSARVSHSHFCGMNFNIQSVRNCPELVIFSGGLLRASINDLGSNYMEASATLDTHMQVRKQQCHIGYTH